MKTPVDVAVKTPHDGCTRGIDLAVDKAGSSTGFPAVLFQWNSPKELGQ